ncbi:MAG TPA: DoxX family protein [Vicinamibacterales bacterium]|nr:DoxX family protein [Vicinamibacterales bacterium]
MFVVQVVLAVVFVAAGVMKLAKTRDEVAHNPQFSAAQVRLLGAAELLGAVGLVAPTITGVAPFLTRVAAACLATLMGGAVATLAIGRKQAIVPTVVALVLIAIATVR